MKSYLSFFIASVVVLGLFGVVHSLKSGKDGAAFASPGTHEASLEDNSYSFRQKQRLRREFRHDPESVLGFTGRDVRAALNEPELVRRDAPTIVWQYRNKDCILDLYFTTSKNDAAAAPVIYYEMRSREESGASEASSQECASSLVSAQSGPSLMNVSALYKSR